MNELSLLTSADSKGEKLYVDSVFSAFTYTGNGSTQTIVNGIDLAGKGGLVWIKRRAAQPHALFDTARGAGINGGSTTKILSTNLTSAESWQGPSGGCVTSFNSNGFTVAAGTNATVNASSANDVAWTFRNAPKFFTHSQVTKTAGSNATVDLSTLGTVGMVKVKRTDAVGSWYVWHRSLTAGQLLIGESTAAAATLGQITVVGTTLTLVNGVIADGTYHVEAYAHDTSADGLIQCGSFTTDGSGNAAMNLGWEPQYLLWKRTDNTSSCGILDVARGYTSGGADEILQANVSTAGISSEYGSPTATGFTFGPGAATVSTFIYLAIRRPNKPPTLGTQVYNAIARTGTDAVATVTGVGFAPDLVTVKCRNAATGNRWEDRLRGATKELVTETTAAETTVANSITAFGMDGVAIGNNTDWNNNSSSNTYIHHFFKRAQGVFDVVCYTGTGVANTEAHGLGVVPELIIVKPRNNATDWVVGGSIIPATQYLYLNATNALATATAFWNSLHPTATAINLGDGGGTNGAAFNYVTYLFATKAGISKVFAYTGNGTSQTINCGFTTGARFVLIKRTDATGDWFIWDTVRGIVAGNDPHLSLNSTAAEVTTDDSIDPDVTGFIVNQLAATNINVSGASYIGLAYA